MGDFLSKARRWLMWPWRLMLVTAFVFAVVNNLQVIVSPDAWNANANSASILGMDYGPSSVQAPRWIGVTVVETGGAAQEAGLRAGDSVRFDTFLGQEIRWQPGERVGLAIARGEERLRATIIARAPPQDADPAVVTAIFLIALYRLVALGFIALLVVRGYRNRSALQMAAILLGTVAGLNNMQDGPLMAQAVAVLFVVASATTFYLWPVFCLELTGGASSRRQAWLVYGFSSIIGVVSVLVTLARNQLFPTFGLNANTAYAGLLLTHNILAFAVISSNFGRVDASRRNRIKIVVGAFACLMVSSLMSNLELQVVSQAVTMGVTLAMRFVALAILTYGILKQRLFDMGFALNRTLVYGAAAFTLLITFGLVEYVAKSMIPVAWPTAGPFISAGLAVLLFLMFHRLHHWFEHHIERFFFGDWQRAEAALKRFVESAGHFDRMPVLCGTFTDALSRYSGGANAALYLRDGDGTYRLESGTLEGTQATYDDDPAFALMRTERRPVFLMQAAGSLPGTLALPMLDQGALHGFALLGTKPDNANYRPDEIENLGWAAHQVGLDLQALQARELRAEVAKLSERNASLSDRTAVLEKDQGRLAAEKERLMAMLENAQSALGRT